MPKKVITLIFCSSKGENCATHPVRTPDTFGMAICIRCRGPNLGKSSRTSKKKQEKRKRQRKREKKKKRKKNKGKKRKKKKGAEKTDKKTSLTGARVHPKSKKQKKIAKSIFCPKNANNPYFLQF